MEQQRNVLVAVFATRQEAEAVAKRLTDAGAPSASVRVADPRDEVASMQGEMREEMENTFVSPQAALAVDKEGARSMTVLLPIAIVVGALLFSPLAFVDFGLTFAGRLLIAAVCGAVAGATAAFVIAGGIGAKGSAENLAGEEGFTVRVVDPSDRVEQIVMAAGADRVDRFDGSGMPTATPVSGASGEGATGPVDTVKAGLVDLREGGREEERSPQDAGEATTRGRPNG